jgi:1,2-diacylglycerol 3-alpha-glucosyltransferase
MCEKMKIAMFTDSYLPSRDGVVTSILLSRKSLEALGHEVIIFAPEPKDPRAREDGVYYFKSKSFNSYQGYSIPMFPTDKCHILKKLDVDIIHAQGLLFMGLRSMFAGRTLKLPVVVSFHTMITDAAKFYNFTPLPDWVVTRLMWTYLKDLLERADSVIVPTMAIKTELDQLVPRMRHIEVIPTGVDTVMFNPNNSGAEMRTKYGLDGGKVILTVGRIAWEKNLDLILEGFKILHDKDPHTKLMVAGEGPAKAHAKQKAIDLGIQNSTYFPGFVPDSDLPGLYAASDAFTIASKFETQGLVVLEAMASGKPCSGINYRAIAEIIEDNVNGFTFSESPASWARATELALGSDKRVGLAARRRAEEYSLMESAKKMVDLYEYAIEAKRKRLAK